MKLRLLILAILAVCTQAFAQDHFRFVVTGDDRWNTNNPRQGMDDNGVNVAAMDRLATAIVAEKPAILLFNGDCVGGGETDDEETSQFKTFMISMEPIYLAGIKVLAIRGNHEMHCPNPTAVWQAAFAGDHANPGGGPSGEEDLTYSFTYGNTLFLGLDEFQTSKPTINQDWLDQTLAGTKATHIFAFAHKMAFKSGNHVDGMNTVPEARDKFLTSLSNAGGRMVFFGHDHLYDHETALKTGWPANKAIHQVVVGTGGAPFVHGKNQEATDGNWALTHLGHVEGKIGYVVVDIAGPKVTVTYKAESAPNKFETADSFSYTVAK
ncbi:MAG TPA: metallophosphoesterase [Fimbriimonadaceae bacterium]|jgi:hypothetical protein